MGPAVSSPRRTSVSTWSPRSTSPSCCRGGACLFAAGLATASFLVAAFLQHTYSSASTAIPVGVWPIAIFNLVLLNVVAGLTALLAAAYRQSRRQLAESEECFRSVAKAATDAILVTDDAGSVVVSNRAAEAMFGYPSTEMLRTPLARLVLIPDRYREPGGHAPQGLRTTGVKPIALTGVKIDGAQFPAELSVERWTTRRGTFFTCIVRDVTSRRKIEELAHESGEVLRAVVQSSPIAVWAHRFDGGLTIWNPAAERMFGWTADEVLGNYPPFVPDDRLSESHSIFERALAGAELLNVEVCRRRKDGTDIDVSLSTAPLRNAEGTVTGTVTLGLDISERKELERQAAPGVQSQAGLLLECLEAARGHAGHRTHPAAADRRGRRAPHQPERRSRLRRGRSGSARAGDHEPRGQRT